MGVVVYTLKIGYSIADNVDGILYAQYTERRELAIHIQSNLNTHINTATYNINIFFYVNAAVLSQQ